MQPAGPCCALRWVPCAALPWAVLQQGLWSSTGGCCALRWVPCAALQVTLAGYGFAFRFCPGGKHVAWREGSRTPHEGTVEFISLDSHKGTGGSGFVTHAGASCWHCWQCCFPGIHMHQELDSYLGCSLLPLDGCCVGTCQVIQ